MANKHANSKSSALNLIVLAATQHSMLLPSFRQPERIMKQISFIQTLQDVNLLRSCAFECFIIAHLTNCINILAMEEQIKVTVIFKAYV